MILLLAGKSLYSQKDTVMKISGDFQGLTFVEFFSSIESKVPCFFYFDKNQLDSSLISFSVRDEPLRLVLDRAFKNTALQFSIDQDNKVYITRNLKIITTLPPGFFSTAPGLVNAPSDRDSIADFNPDTKKHGSRTENKLYEIGTRTNIPKENAILTGHLRSAKTGEPLINTSVFINNDYATLTDGYGYFSLTVPVGKQVLNIVGIGLRDTRLQLMVYSDGKLDVDVPEQVTTLKEVIVSSRKTSNITSVQLGVTKLAIENIRRVPVVFGESDVMRVVTGLPGVQTVGEATTGFNVRGGSADQNLILFNDASIFNPSHFFGMFSAFNPEVIKDIELYKSSIPAKYGGRLSSVLDVTSREGNKKNITGSAGIGAITTRLNVEGPLQKDRSSFIFGGRTTYANWLLNLLPEEYKHSKASFQDFCLGLSHMIDSSDNLYFTGYFSSDRFALNSDTTYGYNNYNGVLKWKHSFNNKLSGEFLAGIDQYKYKVYSEGNKVNAFTMQFNIRQMHAKANFVYYLNLHHSFDFGVSTIRYNLQPGSFQPKGQGSLVLPDAVEEEQAQESALYLSHRFNPNNKLSVYTGVRYTLFNYLGPQEVSYYVPGQPRTESTRTGTVSYGKGKVIRNYDGPEVRFSIRYILGNNFSVKAGYNSQHQYIHVLSNTTAIAPTDIWKLSDPNIKPQYGDQVSVGFYKNLKSNTIETSLEVYYKNIRDYLDYKPGASLLLNHHIETEVINTKGRAYGVELLVKKTAGKLTGWISYTYSRIQLRSDDPDLATQVNKGEYYPANYDKPHDVTLTGIFRVNHRFSVSLNSTYSTGRPITLPIGRFYYAGSARVLYSDRNAYRIPDYSRTDFSMVIDGNHKVHQKTHNSWTIGVYNLLGRRNPYSVYFISENGAINGYRLSIFGSAIPFVNFNITF